MLVIASNGNCLDNLHSNLRRIEVCTCTLTEWCMGCPLLRPQQSYLFCRKAKGSSYGRATRKTLCHEQVIELPLSHRLCITLSVSFGRMKSEELGDDCDPDIDV